MTKIITTKQKGFTLVELLVVIGIIAALAAVVIPNVSRFVGAGDDAAGETEMQTVQAAMDLYMAQNALTDVNGSGTTSPFAGGTRNFSNAQVVIPDGPTYAISPDVLYPEFLRQNPTKCEYAWDTTGQVVQDPDC